MHLSLILISFFSRFPFWPSFPLSPQSPLHPHQRRHPHLPFQKPHGELSLVLPYFHMFVSMFVLYVYLRQHISS